MIYLGLAGRHGREEERGGREEREDEEERDGDEIEIPNQFKLCSSMLEICNWLVNTRPDILNLAYQMLEAKKLVSLPPSAGSSNSSASSTQQVKYIALLAIIICSYLL